jgi:hypothetical protein
VRTSVVWPRGGGFLRAASPAVLAASRPPVQVVVAGR